MKNNRIYDKDLTLKYILSVHYSIVYSVATYRLYTRMGRLIGLFHGWIIHKTLLCNSFNYPGWPRGGGGQETDTTTTTRRGTLEPSTAIFRSYANNSGCGCLESIKFIFLDSTQFYHKWCEETLKSLWVRRKKCLKAAKIGDYYLFYICLHEGRNPFSRTGLNVRRF